MSLFIVDASVAIKWFIPEIHADAAKRLQDLAHQLHVPNLFDVEITNILWKKMERGELTRLEADSIMVQLSVLPVTRHLDASLLTMAFDLAVQCHRTAYDCLYLALAQRENGRMVTADDRLVNSLVGTKYATLILSLQNVP